jgi:hypothetical protein
VPLLLELLLPAPCLLLLQQLADPVPELATRKPAVVLRSWVATAASARCAAAAVQGILLRLLQKLLLQKLALLLEAWSRPNQVPHCAAAVAAGAKTLC